MPIDAFGAEGCRPVTAAELKAEIAKDVAIKKIEFFAAWCADCKVKLQAAGKDTVLVSVFDTPQNADKLWSSVNGKTSRCFIDADESVARVFAVKSLPHAAPVRRQ